VNNSSSPEIKLKCGPVGRRRLGRPSKRLGEAETGTFRRLVTDVDGVSMNLMYRKYLIIPDSKREIQCSRTFIFIVTSRFVLRTVRSGDLIPGGGGRDFPHPSRPAPAPTQPPIQWVPGLLPEVERPGRGVDHPPPSSAEVKERIELYSYI
jgi:hypothetical protein